MAITWTIDWMRASTQEINGFTEVVLDAGWRITGDDGKFTTSSYGSVTFPEPQVGGSYTPYADLTQDQVLGWVWENGVDKDAYEKSTVEQLALLANPPVIQPPLPWAK
jgi:hypothetical protein